MKLNQNIQKHHTFLRFSRWNFSPHEGCLWTPESRKILRIESEMLDFGIRNTAQGIRNPTSKLESTIQVLLTKTGIEYLESGIHSVESTIQDCLGFPHMDRNFLLHKPHQSIPELAIYKVKMKLTVLFEVCCVHFLSSNSFVKKFIQSFRLEFAHRKSVCGFINEI